MIKEQSQAIMLKLKLQNLFSKRNGKDRRRLIGNAITRNNITLEDLTGKDVKLGKARAKCSTHRNLFVTLLRIKN